MTIGRHVNAASAALDAHAAWLGIGDDRPREDTVLGLLCDLMHLCAAEGVEFDEVLAEAREHFAGEAGEEEAR